MQAELGFLTLPVNDALRDATLAVAEQARGRFDDVLLLAPPKDSDGIWRVLGKSICFKDPEAPLARYLGVVPLQ